MTSLRALERGKALPLVKFRNGRSLAPTPPSFCSTYVE
jgi:hypothetical protein